MDAFIRPKRFVVALILGIIALITIFASLAASTTALVQEVHIFYHDNDLSKNVLLALVKQELIDEKLKAKLPALKILLYGLVMRSRASRH